MRIQREELEHPTQASRVALNVFELPAGPNAPGIDTPSENGGFLVTEERIGTVVVTATLGFFDRREDALARARSRAEELKNQRYRPATAA